MSKGDFMNTPCTIRTSKEKIFQEWEIVSLDKLQGSSDRPRTVIRVHLPHILDALCTILETGIYKNPVEISKIHGQQRFTFGDYNLHEVLEEYSLLKNIIFDEMILKNSLNLDSIRLIDKFFDSASSVAAVEFTELREQQLKNISNNLEISNFDLQTYAAIAAHDLKSPTATIIGFTQLVLEEAARLPKEVIRSIQTIEKISLRMLSLIDRLLEYSKIESSNAKKEIFSLMAAAEEAKLNLNSDINAANAEFIFHNLSSFIGDRILFAQLFQNIFANSLKFKSPDRSLKIEVTTSLDRNSLVLTIRDNGIGFDPKWNSEIFQPFKKGDTEIAGNGLGLATVKKIVSMHGGTVSASGRPNEGAEIKISFPLNNT